MPNECVEYSIMTEGMARQMGVHSTPPIPLQWCHIRWMLSVLDLQYRQNGSNEKTLEVIRCALVIIFLWLGWLRSMVLFSLRIRDVQLTLPKDGAIYNLPEGVGVLGLKLLPNTKASQTRNADVWIAHTTSSGILAGKWWRRFLARKLDQIQQEHVFVSRDGRQWNSNHFRTTFLYPWLSEMRSQGDIYLRPHDGTDNNSIPYAFYSLGSFHRGARLDVDQQQEGSNRKATPREITEHGRWRTRRAPDMSTHYLEWGVEEKVKLTFYAQ